MPSAATARGRGPGRAATAELADACSIIARHCAYENCWQRAGSAPGQSLNHWCHRIHHVGADVPVRDAESLPSLEQLVAHLVRRAEQDGRRLNLPELFPAEVELLHHPG